MGFLLPHDIYLTMLKKWAGWGVGKGRRMDKVSGEVIIKKIFYLPSKKGSPLKGKNLLPWEQILSF